MADIVEASAFSQNNSHHWPTVYLGGQADANKAYGFAIFMRLVGAFHTLRSFRRRLPWALNEAAPSKGLVQMSE